MKARTAALILSTLGLATGVLIDPVVAIAGVVLAAGVYIARRILRARTLSRRIDEAVRDFDPEALHVAVNALFAEPDLRPGTVALLHLNRAVAFMMQERYAEARAALDEVNAQHLSSRMQLALGTNRAWCSLHLGEVGDETLEALGEIVETARTEHAPALGPAVGTLGVARLFKGEPALAVPLLREAIAEEGAAPALQAVHAFYLGEALQSLGDAEGARSSWKLAAQKGPQTPHGRRAQARLV